MDLDGLARANLALVAIFMLVVCAFGLDDLQRDLLKQGEEEEKADREAAADEPSSHG